MRIATESHKAAVERAIEKATQAVGHNGAFVAIDLISPDGVTRSIFASDLRHLMDAARAGIAGEEEAEAKAPACIHCGGKCVIDGGCPDFYVRCLSDDCEAVGPTRRTKATAVEAFARPAALAARAAGEARG